MVSEALCHKKYAVICPVVNLFNNENKLSLWIKEKLIA